MRAILTIIILECLAFNVGQVHPLHDESAVFFVLIIAISFVFFMGFLDIKKHLTKH